MTPTRLAGCIIKDNEERILLIHRIQPGKEQWETPGGKVEVGETDEITAIRELKEEIGVEVIIHNKIGEGDFKEGDNLFHYVWFAATLTSKTKFSLEPRFVEAKYFSLTELTTTSLPLSAGTKRFLELFG